MLDSQHRQNYLNNYFPAEVGKDLPKQFPESFPIGRQGVSNLAPSSTAKTLEARKKPKQFEGRSLWLGNLLLDQLLK